MISYTEEQKKEIQERVKKANDMLQELELAPVANVQPYMLPIQGDSNVFAFKVIPVYADLKYKPEDPKAEEATVKEKK